MKRMMVFIGIIVVFAIAFFLYTAQNTGGESMTGFKSITMDEAKEIFKAPGDYIILDVRRPDEFAEGHVPNAINVANETIGTSAIAELPDMDQVIYVYCRSGNRSKDASRKLAAIGYTNIIECGGIIDWTGDIER
ncbi:MAG: rhodanese-like domain-containing protein [Pseudobutyrivibrio sp.]|nr:rhodanese-like domain-containing protein [Pseudobutyrivibrio sp.]